MRDRSVAVKVAEAATCSGTASVSQEGKELVQGGQLCRKPLVLATREMWSPTSYCNRGHCRCVSTRLPQVSENCGGCRAAENSGPMDVLLLELGVSLGIGRRGRRASFSVFSIGAS
jgi:hypothetical protein